MFCRRQRTAKNFLQSRRLVRRSYFLPVSLWQKGERRIFCFIVLHFHVLI